MEPPHDGRNRTHHPDRGQRGSGIRRVLPSMARWARIWTLGLIMANRIKPLPPEFKAEFIRKGWRHVEHIYGARTDLIRKWLYLCGLGDEAERAAVRRGRVSA